MKSIAKPPATLSALTSSTQTTISRVLLIMSASAPSSGWISANGSV
ncbi:MAG: hypothetical protein P8Z80_19605 [Pseudolabrys sp.]